MIPALTLDEGRLYTCSRCGFKLLAPKSVVEEVEK